MDYQGLCRGCGAYPGKCACDQRPMPPGRLEDIDAIAAVSAAAGLECVAPATLLDAGGGSREVAVAKLADASLAVLDAAGRHSRVYPDEALPPDYEEELRSRFSLELSPEDADLLQARLEEAGWRVGRGRVRRRNDLLGRLELLDAAAAATGDACIAAVDVVDEGGEPYGAAVVARSALGTLRLLDGMDHSELPPDGLTISFLPGDEPLARDIQDAGYAVFGAAKARRPASQTAYLVQASPNSGGRMLVKRMSYTDTCKGCNQAGPYIPKEFARSLGTLEDGATECRSLSMDLRIVVGARCLGEREVHYRWEHKKGEYRLTCLSGVLREHAEEGDIFTIDLGDRTFRLVRRAHDGDWQRLADLIGRGRGPGATEPCRDQSDEMQPCCDPS